VNGSIAGREQAEAAVDFFLMFSAVGMAVYQSFHSSSLTASTRVR
jgi:hypothetical protein